MQHAPLVAEHPYMSRADWARSIPFGIHGDGGKYSHQDSLFVIAMNSLLGAGATSLQRFLITTIRKAELVDDTLDSIFAIAAWSFNAMLTGLSPSMDWQGRKVAGKPRYLADGNRVLMSVRGDWEFFSSVFRFPYWHGATNMCWQCAASSSNPELTFTDFSQTAKWRTTRRTHASYLAELERDGKVVPALFGAVGLRIEAVMVDILHTVDLGITAHIVANMFWELALAKTWPGIQTEAVSLLTAEMKAWLSRTRAKYRLQGELSVSRIRTSNDWPKLKGKAAQLRCLSRFALEFARKHDSGSQHDRRRSGVAQLLVRFCEIVDQEGTFLSDAAVREMQRTWEGFANVV